MAEKSYLYRGFNLLLCCANELFHFNNKDCQILKLSPGVHGLSNGLLDSPWPKVKRLKSGVSAEWHLLKSRPFLLLT
ncbi:NRDE family protein [Alcanivorax sp.]|uniref:NRDE family protein n=1 Tax=Alcanivorax sp. TaxID=1872427 RepID=UPI003A91E2C2